MNQSSIRIKSTLVAALLAMCGATASAQESPVVQSVAAATEQAAAVHFDAQYEDSGIKVIITKIFPQYQMREGQMVANQTIFLSSALKQANYQLDSHRIFHTVSDETAEITFTPVIAGTRAGIAAATANENTNKVAGAIGVALTFAATRSLSGASTSALANLSGLRDVAGMGMLKSANFQDTKVEGTNQSVQAGPEEVIFVGKLVVKHSQNDNSLGESMLYFVPPKEMRSEVLNGENLHNYNLNP